MLKKLLIVLIVVAAILFLASYPKVYVIQGSAGGSLFWNANEALLFMAAGSSGAHMSYPRYALEPYLSGLASVRLPNDEICSQIVVIRITDKDVQRYDTQLSRYAEEPYCGYKLAPFESQIYEGYLAKDKIWKWTENGFEPATSEELREFDAANVPQVNASRPHPWEFDDVEGWSMRGLGLTTPKYDIVLHGQPLTILFHGESWPPAPISLELIRSGQPAQTIWSFDGRPHPVTKAEYKRTFAR